MHAASTHVGIHVDMHASSDLVGWFETLSCLVAMNARRCIFSGGLKADD